MALQERHGVSNYQQLDCLFNSFFYSGWHQRKYQSSTSLCEEKPSVIGGFPSRKTVTWNVSASHDVIITILASESQNIQIVNMTPVDKPCIIWDRSKQNNHSNTIITFSFLFFFETQLNCDLARVYWELVAHIHVWLQAGSTLVQMVVFCVAGAKLLLRPRVIYC